MEYGFDGGGGGVVLALKKQGRLSWFDLDFFFWWFFVAGVDVLGASFSFLSFLFRFWNFVF